MIICFSISVCAKEKHISTIKLQINNFATISGDAIDLANLDKDILYILAKKEALNSQDMLYVIIVSSGGNYEAMLQYSKILDLIPNITLICKACFSAAAGIFVNSSHPRLVISKSKILLHEMYLSHFTAEMSKKSSIVQDLQVDSDNFNKIFYLKMKMKKEDYDNKIKDFNWYIEKDEALKLNLADEEVKIECDKYVKKILIETCKN